ncbi:MAG: hypothetical protein KA972_04865, partial [Brachymonas sp.]|nr:hypothetical protein [Brachymonas sp.]
QSLHQTLQHQATQLQALQQRWQAACHLQIEQHGQRLVRCANSLRLLDPQQVLERGFSLLQDETGRLLSRQADFHAGQRIVATVRDGQVPLTPLAPLSPASPHSNPERI